jgi:ketopantoate hydroxymethyltransferase
LVFGAAAYLPTYGIAFAAALAAEAMHGIVELVRRGIVVVAKLGFLPLAALACLVFPDKDTPVRRVIEGVKAWWREFA